MPTKRRKRAPNPLKMDPTRTATLRRAFSAMIRKRFARLRFEIRKLLVDEDAFGLTETNRHIIGNVFCPTGEGGGVDPTCSPGGGGSSHESSRRDRMDYLNRVYGKGKYVEGFPGSSDVRFDELSRAAYDIVRTNTPASKDVHPVRTADNEIMSFHSDTDFSIYRDTRKGVKGFRMDSGASSAFVPEHVSKEDFAVAVHKVTRSKLPKELKEHADRKKLLGNTFVVNDQQWRFRSSPDKIKAFQEWLRRQFGSTLTGKSDEQLWEAYIEAGFRKGAGRAFDDVNKAERVIAASEKKTDFFNGTRDQFLRASFGQPEAIEKVKLLAGRSFDDLEGVTSDMSTRMSRTLTDGLVQGKGAREIARDMDKDLDIGRSRAELIARTELVRAHAEGQLTALENLGVEEVGVSVEWLITPDERVCPACEELEGVVLKIDEARGMLPRHPG